MPVYMYNRHVCTFSYIHIFAAIHTFLNVLLVSTLRRLFNIVMHSKNVFVSTPFSPYGQLHSLRKVKSSKSRVDG